MVTVTRVIDGDTVEIRPAIDGIEDVRLIGVDTPETVDPNTPDQPFGEQASRFTERELNGERVKLEFDEECEDQDGRLLAYVRFPGNELFNETLLREGYARVLTIPPNDRYEDRFVRAQEQARRAERGLWGLGNGEDRNCADFPTQAAAQAVLDATFPEDPERLDADGDGKACEEFEYPRPPEPPQPPPTGGPPIMLAASALLFGAGAGLMVVNRRLQRLRRS